MGIENNKQIEGEVDIGLLRAPKRMLIAIYAVSVCRSGLAIILNEMYQEEFVIRLIYLGIMLPLILLIAVNHRWAMSSAFAVYVCFVVAIFLFVDSFISILILALVFFLGFLTWRAIVVVGLIKPYEASQQVDVFE